MIDFLVIRPCNTCQVEIPSIAERVLGALGLNLELKARVYETPTLSSLFLLNNYNYVIKALQR